MISKILSGRKPTGDSTGTRCSDTHTKTIFDLSKVLRKFDSDSDGRKVYVPKNTL